MNKLKLFIKQYKKLTVISGVSLIISLVYIFTSEVNEVFSHGEELFSFLNNLALAIIANYIFCYNQVFIPEYNRKKQMSGKIKKELDEIARNISRPLEDIYTKKNGSNKKLHDMNIDEVKNIFNNFDLTQNTGAFHLFVNSKVDITYNEEVFSSINAVSEIINRVNNYYAEYMDDRLLKTLYSISTCEFFNQYKKFIYPLTLNPNFNPDTSSFANILNLEEYYHLYMNLMEEINNINNY